MLACYYSLTSLTTVAMASAEVVLTENDIPGACLPEPFESHTIPQLRWWLLCRGIVAPRSLLYNKSRLH